MSESKPNLRPAPPRNPEAVLRRLEWTVLDWNEPAIRFYRRLGAAPEDDWTIYRLTGDALAALAGGRSSAG